jgi:hypothetical protein
MHLFLHLHKVQRTSGGFFIGLVLQDGGNPIFKCNAPEAEGERAGLGPRHYEPRATSYQLPANPLPPERRFFDVGQALVTEVGVV